MTNPRASHHLSLGATGLTILAGLAVGIGSTSPAEAISFAKLRTNHSAWNSVAVPARDMDGNIIWTDLDGDGFRDRFETEIAFQPITGQGVTVGMIEFAHPLINVRPGDPRAPFEHHIAFDGIDHRRIWYPFEEPGDTAVSTVRREIGPRTFGGSLRFPTSFHQHATAVAGAICARNPALEGDIGSVGPITGIAPNVQLLSGALVTEVDPQDPGLGPQQGVTVEAFLFTLAAMTDLDVDGDGEGDYIEPLAEWYGVEPWQPASVINISAGNATTIEQRAGEDVFARIADLIALKTNTLIIAAAGDEGQNGELEEEENDSGRIASPASAHNTISVGRTGDSSDFDSADEDSSFGPQARFNWIHGDLDGNLYLTVPTLGGGDGGGEGGGEGMGGDDYSDINFLDGEDPRDPPDQSSTIFADDRRGNMDGFRPGVDIVAPGTLLELPGNLTLPEGVITLTGTWGGFEGTSFATAIVSGAAALLNEYGRAWEYSTDPLLLRAVLLNSADKPQNWDADATPNTTFDFASSSNQGLDDTLGAGIIDFERLLLQYRTTAGGYPDLDEASQEVLFNSIRPLFRRDPSIGGDPADPDFMEGPNMGTFGTITFMPVVGALRDRNQYFDTFVNQQGQSEPISFLFTDPDFAMVTFFNDPTAASSAVIAPEAQRTDDTSANAPEPQEGEGSWRNYAAQPVPDRFDFPGGGGSGGAGNRTGGTGGGRTGTTGGGISTGDRPGGGGGGGGGDGIDGGGTSASGLRPCTSPVESRCVRTGWDIGRLGVGSIDLPIGGVPENTDIIATLVWHRIEQIDDSVYEELLNGVITADPPPPPSLRATEPTLAITEDGALAASQPAEPVMTPDELFAIDNAHGPEPEQIYTRKAPKTWNSDRANYTTYPLVMAGETLRGPAPDFIDLDLDRDGVDDFGIFDNCLISFDELVINNVGIPFDPALDSYNPEQIDMDDDGCGPPCDSDDAVPSFDPAEEPFCFFGATGQTNDFNDSERLRRIASDYFNTPRDVLNINPAALSGVVALRINRGAGEFDMATGVLIDDQRILTAAHPFDRDNDGVRDVDSSVSVAFAPMGRDARTVPLQGATLSRFDIHPSFNYSGDRIEDGFDPTNIIENGHDDLAVITFVGTTFSEFIEQFTDAVPGALPYDGTTLQTYPIFTGDPPSLEDSQEIIFAGFGESGDGRFGVPVDPSALLPEQLPPGFVPAGFNLVGAPVPVLRVGKNVVEAYPRLDNDDDLPGNTTAPVEVFAFDFDEPLSPASLGNRVESMITFGDSGSPSFIHNDINLDGNVDPGELQLFAINTMMNVPAGSDTLSTFNSRGLGMVLSSYLGQDDDGNDRFLQAILNDAPPATPSTVAFGNGRPGHFDLTTAFKYDNLSLALFRESVGGGGFSPVATYTSSSANNVEHVFAQSVAQGQYFLRITWDGPVFDWSGFLQSGPTPFRKVPPVGFPENPDALTPDDLIDFFPAEVKYGLAWWADLPFDRLFERTAFGGRSMGQLRGDLNQDMAINSADLAVMLSAWGSSAWECDLNDSGVVDMNDLAILLQNYER